LDETLAVVVVVVRVFFVEDASVPARDDPWKANTIHAQINKCVRIEIIVGPWD
jgi:hypothetical protein